jgi:CBS domain containing-hemolysin-like protein
MTPLDKVFMLSSAQRLDDATLAAIMSSKPFSRVPVYRRAQGRGRGGGG